MVNLSQRVRGSAHRTARRLAMATGLAIITTALPLGAIAHASKNQIPLAPFNECPTVGASPSSKVLLVVNPDSTVSVYGDPTVGDYDGGDDTLVGIWNTSATAVNAVTVSGAGSYLAGLDGDGLCTYNVTGCPFGPTGYEGPHTSLVTDPGNPDAAEVDFTGGLAPNATTFFSLEGTLTDAVLTARQGHLNTLHLATKVVNFTSWVDPTHDPVVTLQIDVANGNGTPATGAQVRVSNSPATFTINNSGRLNLVQRITAGTPDVTVTATLGGNSATAAVHLYDTTVMTQCHLPGEPNKLDAATYWLDYVLPNAPAG